MVSDVGMNPISESLVGRRLPQYINTHTKETRPRSWANITVAEVEAYQPDVLDVGDIHTAIWESATSWRGDDEDRKPLDEQTFKDQLAARVRSRDSRFAGCGELETEIDWLIRTDQEFKALLGPSKGKRRGLENYETE